MKTPQFCPQGRSMNTYSNDQSVMYLKLLNVLIPCQEFPPDGGGFFDQAVPTTLIR